MTDKLVQIKNLKTFFNTEAGIVKAVNNQGIGKPSNIVTISPNGNTISNNDPNMFATMDEDLDRIVENSVLDFNCEANDYDEQRHSLDSIDHSNIDIQNYIRDSSKI